MLQENFLKLSPIEFLNYLYKKITKENNFISEDIFNLYTKTNPEVWDSDTYDTIFYFIADYLEEKIPRRVYNLSDLKEDIEEFLVKGKISNT